ncbi:MAG TPA: putative toxin-antitoxin system toxin component, PIN family [Acidimicrobiales bacterium]|nr:putative toxin-antitoxin system toxin component, PIN family [Acidimicrobiales bacterium]
MLVVLDTNIFVSALLVASGLARRVVQAGVDGEFEYAVCPTLLAELGGVLRRRRVATAVVASEDFVADVQLAARVEPDPGVLPVSRDRRDDYLVALAVAVRADSAVPSTPT